MTVFTIGRDKSRWDWTMMLMVPEWIDHATFCRAIEQVGSKRRPGRLDDVRLRPLREGRCVQTLHLGPFDDEGPVLERMHREFIPEHGLRMDGKYHEIYLSDVRRVAPEKLRTILRQPVRLAMGPFPPDLSGEEVRPAHE